MSNDAQQHPFLVLNRWGGVFTEYDRYLGQPWPRIAYLGLPGAAPAVPAGGGCAYHVAEVPDLELATVLPIAEKIAACSGGFAGIVALSEFDLMTAAVLRERFATPGYSTDFVRRFRDKVLMKTMVAAAGIAVPRFLPLAPRADPGDIIAKLGLPVILKPRGGAASHGVVRVEEPAELAAAIAPVDAEGYECEAYISGPVLHVDGVRRNGRFHFVSASAYIGTCLGFAQGRPLGSVLLDDTPRRRRVVQFAAACLDALEHDDGPFHLELIEHGTGELVFLEVGLRPGGGEITYVHHDLFGVDLVGEAVRATVSAPVLAPSDRFRAASGGGFVMVPEPGPFPSQVIDRVSLLGTVSSVYAEFLPDVGEIFDGKGGYEHIGGRFHLRGPGEAQVRRDVDEIMRQYRLFAQPVAGATVPS
jgi:hypothetical protein